MSLSNSLPYKFWRSCVGEAVEALKENLKVCLIVSTYIGDLGGIIQQSKGVPRSVVMRGPARPTIPIFQQPPITSTSNFLGYNILF